MTSMIYIYNLSSKFIIYHALSNILNYELNFGVS